MRPSLLVSACLSVLCVHAACDSGEGKAEAEAKAELRGEGEAKGEAKVEGDVSDNVAQRAKGVAEGTAAIDVEIKADMLDLDGTVDLIKSGKVKDARELEKRLNDPKGKLAQIDIDGDGIIDFIQVVEVHEGTDLNFELRVIPSTKQDADYAVTVAAIAVVPDRSAGKVSVRATYTAVVEHHDVYVYEYAVPATWEGDVIVVVDAPFFGWAYGSHDVYVGVYVHEEWIAVPGVVIHVGGHGKFKKHKFKKHKFKKHKFKKGKGHKGKIKIKF